ncbi:unnamed protein product, partial [marine sediment metagenome]
MESALEGITLGEKIQNNLSVGSLFWILGASYLIVKGEPDIALKYTMKGLNIMEELKYQNGIAICLSFISHIYLYKGDLYLALEYCKKSLSNNEISDNAKAITLHTLGGIYRENGELQKALKYYKQGILLSEELGNTTLLIAFLTRIGTTYRMVGNHEKALKYITR